MSECKFTRNRKRINEAIDKDLLIKIDTISNQLDVPKSRIFEDSIEYILKTNSNISNKVHKKARLKNRASINLTINSILWTAFKNHASENKYKLADLLEIGLRYSIKKFEKKMKKINFKITQP